jgi:hypothetical protein
MISRIDDGADAQIGAEFWRVQIGQLEQVSSRLTFVRCDGRPQLYQMVSLLRTACKSLARIDARRERSQSASTQGDALIVDLRPAIEADGDDGIGRLTIHRGHLRWIPAIRYHERMKWK